MEYAEGIAREELENKGIEAFVKYGYFHKEQTKKWKEDPRRIENLHYNEKQDCYYCPMRGSCHKARGNRKIEVNPRLIRYKEIIKERLNSERGKRYRSLRPVDVEGVFGNIKNNHNFM